jgi:hypothetical protein
VGLQQPQRLGHEVWPVMPWRRTQRSDLPRTDRLSVLLVLCVPERAQHDSLLSRHRRQNLQELASTDWRFCAGPCLCVVWHAAPGRVKDLGMFFAPSCLR